MKDLSDERPSMANWKRWMLGLSFGFLAAVLLIIAVAPEPPAAVSAPHDVTVTLPIRANTDLMRVIRAGDEIADSAQELAGDDARRGARNVRFVLKLEGHDRYGNEELWPFLTLTYSMAELRKVNYDNIESWDMLDLASEVTAEGGYTHRAVADYCAEMSSPGFCSKAR